MRGRCVLLAGAIGLLLLPWLADAQTMTRVIVGSGAPSTAVISADGGCVVFDSLVSNLVPGDTNDNWDVFVHDIETGVTTRVSVGPSGAQANFGSAMPGISANGRWVVFASWASNLVPNDTNGQTDIFVHDRQMGTTSRVSVATGAGQGDRSSYYPAISADGRWVAFHSFSSFVPGDTNGVADVFVHDRQTGTTTRVSVGPGGAQANGQSVMAAISADGRFVTFESFASNLVAGDWNGDADVFVHDRQTGTTTRVSVGPGGAQANGQSVMAAISADGRWAAFSSSASNLVFPDTNGSQDAFVHDRETGTTMRVSVATGGRQENGPAFVPLISADGRWVVFGSLATNLVADDTNDEPDVFLHDRQMGTTTRVNVGPGGVQANGNSQVSSISAGGRRVAFLSDARNLVPYDNNYAYDLFVYDRGPTPCSFALVPDLTHAPAAGTLGRALVVTEAECGWTAASSDPDWLTVTGGASGNGFGAVEFTVAANPGAPRTGTITIGGQAFIVNQDDVATPLAPTGLVVHSVVGNRVTLRWNMPPGGAQPTGFVLEGGLQPGEVLVSVPTGSVDPAFVFDAPDGLFYARVHTVHGANGSAASNEVDIDVNFPRGPSPPRDLLGVVDGSTVTLAWTNTYEGGAPTSIALDVGIPGTPFTIPLGVTDHVTFAGVPAGEYGVSVRAVNAWGASQPSNPFRVTVPAACSVPPPAPVGLLVYRAGRTVSVFWAPDTTGPAPTQYLLIVTGSFVNGFVLTERSFIAPVAPGEYTFSVLAVNPCGISDGTTPQTVVVP